MKLSKKSIAILSLVILFVVAIVITVVNFLQNEPQNPKITITNWNESTSHVPQPNRTHIEESLYSEINSFFSISPQSATIRDDSSNSTKIEDDFTVGDFIVDLPNIKQSYIVQYYYGTLKDQPTTEISSSAKIICITDPAKIIYPTFSCKDNYNTTDSNKATKDFYLSFLLPHQDALPDGTSFNVEMAYLSNSTIQIIIKIPNCKSATLKEQAEDATKTWLKNQGYNPDDYVYYLPDIYENCSISQDSTESPTSAQNSAPFQRTITIQENPNLSFTNADSIKTELGELLYNSLLSLLESELEKEGISTNHDFTIDLSSFLSQVNFPYTTYSFFAHNDSSVYYYINIAVNADNSYGIIFQKTQPSTGQPVLYIATNSTSEERELIVNSLIEWGKATYPNDITVTTLD